MASRYLDGMRPIRYAMLLSILGGAMAGQLGSRAETTTSPTPSRSVPTPATERWEDLLHSARFIYRTDLDGALAYCDRAIQLAPDSPRPRLMRAAVAEFHRKYEMARRDTTEAIRLDASVPDAWQLRGTLNFKLRHFRESVADFDRYLALVPSRRAEHWQRGISLFYAGDYEAGQKQFELHQTVNPNDVENAVWHFLCVARGRGLAQARAALLKPGPDARVPMPQIYALFAGTGPAERVLAAAANARNSPDAQFYAELYLGIYYDLQADRPRALQHIGNAVALGPDHYMGDVARVHAQVLQERTPTP